MGVVKSPAEEMRCTVIIQENIFVVYRFDDLKLHELDDGKFFQQLLAYFSVCKRKQI